MTRVTLAALLASTLLVSPGAFAQESAVDARLSALVDRAAGGELAAVETELDALSASTNPDLLMAVGDLWKNGLPEVPPLRKPQLDRAADVYRRAAAIPGNHQGRAVFEQARIAAELGGDSADDLLVQAASLGYARALIVQAEAVLPVSPDSAEALGRIAYSLKEPDAALLLARLARIADKGDEAERLTAQAISWLQPKAEAGDASAMENLGEVLIRQGDAAGREWLEKAAATQSGAAKTLAALSLQDDPTGAAALAYFEIATGHGDIDAARKIALLHFDQDRSGVSEEVARGWLYKTVQIGDVRGHILAAQIAGSQDEARALLATAETLWRGDPEDAYQIGRGFDPDAAAGNDAEKAIYWYEQAMAIGSDRAVLKLADLLVTSGTDPDRAAALLETAADSGSIDAKAKLGLMRMEGPLNMRDLSAAAALLLEAAEGGSMTGMNAYARALDNGVFGPPDKEAAIEWWQRAAAQGSARARTKLAIAMIDRAGGPAGLTEAELNEVVRLLTAAANGSNTEAMSVIADLLLRRDPSPLRTDAARVWLRQAADKGRISSLAKLAQTYIEASDPERAVEIFQEAADRGHVGSMVELARAYSAGLGVAQDLEQGAIWLERAESQGDADMRTMRLIGAAYLVPGADEDMQTRGVDWLSRAADQGDLSAMTRLGRLYRNGDVLAQDYSEAFSWFERAAELGSVSAMIELGGAYQRGEGVPANPERAFQWFSQAEARGTDNANVLMLMAQAYANGVGVPQDSTKAFETYVKAARLGQTGAMERVARSYQRGEGVERDFEQAVFWYRRAAERGSVGALTELARAYASGAGVPLDQMQAYRLFSEAADRGSTYGMRETGRFIVSGRISTAEIATGVALIEKAAELGEVRAMIELASLFRNGFEVDENPERSIDWLERAVAIGSPEAKVLLSRALVEGYGTTVDRDRAVTLLKEAAQEGHKRAGRALAELEGQG